MSQRRGVSGSCSKCGTWRASLHRDHIVPKAVGGPNTPENIQLLCANCHEDKTFAEHRLIANHPLVRERRDAVRRTPEYRERLRQAQLGKKLSPETRARISAANRGRPQSPAHSAAIAAAWTPTMREAARLRGVALLTSDVARQRGARGNLSRWAAGR